LLKINKTVYLLILTYLPGVFFPIIDYLFGRTNPVITWIYMIGWIIYVFILLIIYYKLETRG